MNLEPLHHYNQLYRSMNFERAGLFALLAKMYKFSSVLYPGCSIHITPSFFFPHVIYVDKSDFAEKFFSPKDQVSGIIDANKTYKQRSYWQFLKLDFRDDLPFSPGYFDLILSLYSGEHIRYTDRYLKKHNFVLSINDFSDGNYLSASNAYELIHTIRCRKGKYEFVDPSAPHKESRSGLVKVHRGMAYSDTNLYSLFRKTG